MFVYINVCIVYNIYTCWRMCWVLCRIRTLAWCGIVFRPNNTYSQAPIYILGRRLPPCLRSLMRAKERARRANGEPVLVVVVVLLLLSLPRSSLSPPTPTPSPLAVHFVQHSTVLADVFDGALCRCCCAEYAQQDCVNQPHPASHAAVCRLSCAPQILRSACRLMYANICTGPACNDRFRHETCVSHTRHAQFSDGGETLF